LKKESRPGESGLEEFKLRALQKKADDLCREIEKGVSLEIFFEKEKALREYCLKQFPDKAETYDLIYRARFRRLWKQFRNMEIEFGEEEKLA